jgi:hypothetical protein
MVSFIETRLFTRLVADYLSDEEYRKPQFATHVLEQIRDEIDG